MPKQRRSYDRTERVNQQLLEVISRTLLTEVRDPGVQKVQVTAVKVAPDLRHAIVYYVLMTEDAPEDGAPKRVQKGLERIAGFMRAQIGDKTNLKHIPELDWRYDESIERGRRMEKLISGLHESGEMPEDDGDA